ncbi:hypothetical protein [Thalassospira sp.]
MTTDAINHVIPAPKRNSHWLETVFQVIAWIFLVLNIAIGMSMLFASNVSTNMFSTAMGYTSGITFAISGVILWALFLAIAYGLKYLRKIEANTARN